MRMGVLRTTYQHVSPDADVAVIGEAVVVKPKTCMSECQVWLRDIAGGLVSRSRGVFNPGACKDFKYLNSTECKVCRHAEGCHQL